MNRSGAGAQARPRNRYGLNEWAGAFGDLGTLLPFLLAYLAVLHLDPAGLLFGFGVSMLVCGLVYRTPMPVQPMKAIGATALGPAAQAGLLTPGVMQGACLATGLIWLALGATGAARRLGQWVGHTVAEGVVTGLAMALLWQGLQLMRSQAVLAAAALLLAAWQWRQPRFPALFALLALGLAWTALVQPEAWAALAGVRPQWQSPRWAWPPLSAQELLTAVLLLALPQAPLTLGNAIIGMRAEHNRLFPALPVSERRLAFSTGWMNLFGASCGAVPMCHGAGGLAGHVAFGARTGGSVVILGALLLVLALGFAGAVAVLLQLVPAAVLGTLLLVTAVQLGSGQLRQRRSRAAWSVLLATALPWLWHPAAGMALGLLVQGLQRRRAVQAQPGRGPG